MKFGVTFPQTQIGNDPVSLRDYLQQVEGEGFDFLMAYEHVLGSVRERFEQPGVPPVAYFYYDAFHEPFTFFAWAAALTTRIELMTCVVVLPQRQTALVAKQAAEVDILSGGRLRLGIGVGWNFTEYEGLGQDFRTRGSRQEEQIDLLRRLWTQEIVTFNGRFDRLDRVGINPRPAQPIPIWLGGASDERLLNRVARLADGWVPFLQLSDETTRVLERLRALLNENGRDPSTFGLQTNLTTANNTAADWVADTKRWQSLGATHLGLGGYSRDMPPAEALAKAVEVRRVLAGEIE